MHIANPPLFDYVAYLFRSEKHTYGFEELNETAYLE